MESMNAETKAQENRTAESATDLSYPQTLSSCHHNTVSPDALCRARSNLSET